MYVHAKINIAKKFVLEAFPEIRKYLNTQNKHAITVMEK